MARCLIIGCGCRGRALARELISRGHPVRGTTRHPGNLGAIEQTGAEAVVADPDRIVTVVPGLEHVSVAYVLLGSAAGNPSLHGTRLEMLLHRMVDTTVRGIAYEARGSVDPPLLEAGAALVSAVCEDARIPYVLLRADPGDHAAWVGEAAGAADLLLER